MSFRGFVFLRTGLLLPVFRVALAIVVVTVGVILVIRIVAVVPVVVDTFLSIGINPTIRHTVLLLHVDS